MASHVRVTNLTNGCRLKRSQALGRIAQCLSEWVEEGFTIRDLTLSECVARRSQQARRMEPLAMVEIPGLIYQPPVTAQAAAQRSYRLAAEANRFSVANA